MVQRRSPFFKFNGHKNSRTVVELMRRNIFYFDSEFTEWGEKEFKWMGEIFCLIELRLT